MAIAPKAVAWEAALLKSYGEKKGKEFCMRMELSEEKEHEVNVPALGRKVH
jgi:hypothetical protein